ncbi:ABC-F family ATP-binding cassette domain-containing protein [Kibdelosporangium phytohabitans]|uniref:Antibiotic ABC transporter ATP-binding protein n=1 Tax=Kibdelosporangium phytohabitans TaxID=860235 RepID=A0A0N9HUS0_9PSEU|nr:ABC-F family ATP-binding cassette domain-containing protein [Kibdelosporangium phytohabitans]ALG07206.1 antibiotic ABC transporter ATP-binding protein [Kibdelosporangium phytohabitans]MBE1471945.1 macrolide transport system ATP-binding/permease protein [Kibdelosporangium phytohabitans]
MSSTPYLVVRDLDKVYGDRRVLDSVSLTVSPGQRLGLVGENGVGKSTLLRLLAGTEEADAGEIHRPPDCGFLTQELPYSLDMTVGEVVDSALADIRDAEQRLTELSTMLTDSAALAEYGDLLEWAQAHDIWDADRRAALVMEGLGLSGVRYDRIIGSLSGGQRSRLGLAALLISQPRALLLDEPTNHLDDEAMAFLESQLTRLPGVVVVASHDRVFLDAVCTAIVDLDPARGGITLYGGAYTDYLDSKRAEHARWEQQYESEQDELKRLKHSVDITARNVAYNRPPRDNDKMSYDFFGGRVQKQISRRVRNAQHRLDELTRTQVRKPPAPLKFAATLTATQPDDKLALSVRHVKVDSRLDIGQLDVVTGDRLMVCGSNGAGKSTLLHVLAGRLRPDDGEVRRARGVRVGLLEQDVEFPDPGKTPRQLYTGSAPLAELGLVAPRDLDRPVGHLSVGQRRRLALAVLIGQPPDVLLLDEPTNHLSLSLVEELEDALRSAPGAVVIASHDRWLRRTWEGAELVLRGGHVA